MSVLGGFRSRPGCRRQRPWRRLFFCLGGALAALLELCLAELFAEFDELAGERAEALVLGNLLAGLCERMRGIARVTVLPPDLKVKVQ